jgi:hypothetical protein
VLLVGWQLLELPQAVWLSWVIEHLSEQPAGTAASPASAAAIKRRGFIGPGRLVPLLGTVQFALPIMNSDERFSPVAEVTC